jgi:hypothetical protein
MSAAPRFRTTVQPELVHFAGDPASVKTSLNLTKVGQKEDAYASAYDQAVPPRYRGDWCARGQRWVFPLALDL